ncbi:hypothetical protein ACS8FB_09685 [Psychrobacter sp. 1U1]|uniref:hypothetical protein n=2 Tax=unclassified Psychrobacter TaxID=196806 RepID=UPI003F449357
MEYLLFSAGIIVGTLALVVVVFLVKTLLRLGRYLKTKNTFIWYIYIGFWTTLLLIFLIALLTLIFSTYENIKIDKEERKFLAKNSSLIDSVARDFFEIEYSSDDSFYFSLDVSNLSPCLPKYKELQSKYEQNGSKRFDLDYVITERAQELKEEALPWNNLPQDEQNILILKNIECDKTLGLLTVDEYERRKRIASIKLEKVSRSKVVEEINRLKNSNKNDLEIVEALLINEDFGEDLQAIAQRLRDTGSIDPLYAIGNQFGLNTNDRTSTTGLDDIKSHIKDQQLSSDELREN